MDQNNQMQRFFGPLLPWIVVIVDSGGLDDEDDRQE